MQFRYRARAADGSLREGRLEAADQQSAVSVLQERGLIPVEVRRTYGLLDLRAEIRLGRSRRITTQDLALFCGQLSSLLGAGVPLMQALGVLLRQFGPTGLGPVIESVMGAIARGESLSQAMRRHEEELPRPLIYITSVAEVSGNLDESYALLADYFEQEDQFGRKVRAALTYPAVVLAIATAVLLFMVTAVLPTYANLFRQMGADLPRPTQVLLAVGNGLIRYGYLSPVLILLLWLLIRTTLRRPRAREAFQQLTLRLPVIGGLIYKRELGRLARTLGTMIRSGVPLLSALTTVQAATGFLPMRRALEKVQANVQGGDNLGEALQRQPIFDGVTVEIIGLGETSGNLDAMLFRVANLAEKDVSSLLNRLTSLLEPALTLALGAIILAVIVPMLLPMFDILSQVR